MVQGGLRPGEVMAVRRQDVSAAGAVHVPGGQRRRGRGPTKNGESRLWPISATRLDRTWKKVLKAAGVSYRKPHALRHSFASILLSRGAKLEGRQHAVQDLREVDARESRNQHCW